MKRTLNVGGLINTGPTLRQQVTAVDPVTYWPDRRPLREQYAGTYIEDTMAAADKTLAWVTAGSPPAKPLPRVDCGITIDRGVLTAAHNSGELGTDAYAHQPITAAPCAICGATFGVAECGRCHLRRCGDCAKGHMCPPPFTGTTDAEAAQPVVIDRADPEGAADDDWAAHE
jgi:hypothetical protein